MRTMLASGAARHRHGCHGGRVGSAEEGGEHDASALFRYLLKHVAAVGNRADGDDHEPGFQWVDVKTAELLIGQRRQNDRREQQKLGEGKNLLRGSTGGERLESDLQ